jgi:hypothetical protein
LISIKDGSVSGHEAKKACPEQEVSQHTDKREKE